MVPSPSVVHASSAVDTERIPTRTHIQWLTLPVVTRIDSQIAPSLLVGGRAMLDRAAIALLRPGLEWAARGVARTGVGADQVTIAGFAVGMGGAAAIASSHFGIGLALLLASRFADGLDGALARLTAPTDRGAFLDITLDFIFYASVPLAFALADPHANALPAAVLLAAFIGTGSTFLAFAALAAQRGMSNQALPNKGIYYLGGLTEATETLICFVLMCLWPQQFAIWAYGFAAMCAVTIVTRLAAGWRALEPKT